MRKRVADNDVLASRKSLSRHPLAPSMCVPDASRVVLISAVDVKKHVRFEMLVINLREWVFRSIVTGHSGLS
jgi:hypothetical protein